MSLHKRLTDLETKAGVNKLPYLFLFQDSLDPDYYSGKDIRIRRDDIADLESIYKVILFSWGEAHPDQEPLDDGTIHLEFGDN